MTGHTSEPRSSHIGAHHDWHSESYVRDWISRDITRDSERRPLLRWAASLLPLGSEPARVLDVGGGYGEFAGQVLAEFPRVGVCVQDYSATMLDHARANLEEFADRVTYLHSDLMDPGWVQAVSGPFDAVVSALAIHNLGAGNEIRPLYAAVYSLLAPGGWFFNLDLVLDVLRSPADSPLAELYARATLPTSVGDCHDHDHGPRVIPGAPSLEDHLDWLREVGFSDVNCVRKHLSEVFLAARRPT